jgi:hypothetical protein
MRRAGRKPPGVRMGEETETQGGLNLAERIRRLAKGRTTLDVAQFQFIGLSEIRASYGDRWAEKRERVNANARHFISRRLAPDDVLFAGIDGFLLVFGSFSGSFAEAATHRIARELNACFLGEPDLDDMQLGAQHQAMTLDGFADVFGPALAAASQPAVPQRPPAVAMGYTPIWEAQRGALAMYFISPLDPATGFPMDWDQTSHRHADMDERKLLASEADMRALFSEGKSAMVGVALHVSSLQDPQSLARMLRAMTTFDPGLARLRVLRVSCVEPGYPRIYIEDIMRALRPYAQRIAIGLNWAEPDIASVLKLQPAAIGFSVPPGALGAPALRAEIYARVTAAVEQARASNVLVGVEGDLHAEHAQHFMNEGVKFLCSPRLWPVRATLAAGQFWPRTRLEEMTPGHAA